MTAETKTLVVGDMHCKEELVLPRVDAAVEALGAGRVVFCGDYVDEWRSNALTMRDALDFFGDWVRTRRAQGLGVDLVLGNHDAQYLLHEPGPGTHTALYDEVAEALLALGVRAAVTVGTSLVTHAGVTRAWANEFLDLSDGASADEVATQLNALLDDGVRMSLRMLATAACCSWRDAPCVPSVARSSASSRGVHPRVTGWRHSCCRFWERGSDHDRRHRHARSRAH